MLQATRTATLTVGILGAFVAAPARAAVHYVDATSGAGGNTTLADGSVFSPPVNGATGADNQWKKRTGFGQSGTVYEAGEPGATEDAPRLKTTLTGLIPGESYAIYAYFWSANSSAWRIRLSLADEAGDLPGWVGNDNINSDLQHAPPINQHADGIDIYTVRPLLAAADMNGFEDTGHFTGSVLVSEEDRDMYEAYLGSAVADASGEIAVYVDDLPSSAFGERTWYDGVGYELAPPPPPPYTPGPLTTLTDTAAAPNGAWSWYEDERAVIDAAHPDGPILLASSVSAAPNSDAESGDIDLLWLNLVTGAKGAVELHDRLERDDHDSAGLWVRPDGRYVAAYARHITDPYTRWRVSTNPHDPTAWDPEQTFTNGAGATYNNLYYLPNDAGGAGRLYNFTRTVNFDPNILISSDHGSSWSYGGKLLTEGGGGDRPYVKYTTDGNAIHFVATERHPRNYENSIYHGMIVDGTAYNEAGAVVDGNVFDGAGQPPSAFTRIFQTGRVIDGLVMRRAWTIDMAIANNRPAAIITARVDDYDGDHRFLYARHNGRSWVIRPLAQAGAFLYAAENDYTGLAALDTQDPSVVVISTPIDPRTGETTRMYELYRGETDDLGTTWRWTALTAHSTVDNLRPVIPAYDGDVRVIAWLRGQYRSYVYWDTEVVVHQEIRPDRLDFGCVGGPGVTTPPAGCSDIQFAVLDSDDDGDVDLEDAARFQARYTALYGAE